MMAKRDPQSTTAKVLRRRLWVETGIAALSVVLLLVSILWRDWIEVIFRIDPDQGSGSIEWLIVGLTAFASICCSTLAGREWRRLQPAM